MIWQRVEIPLSISIGVGQYGADANPEDITSRSDQALYCAKQSGKNTVRVFQPACEGQMPSPPASQTMS